MALRLVVSDVFIDDELTNESGVEVEGLAGSAEPFLFILPAAGRRALLAMSELLTYEATWIEIENGRQVRHALDDRQEAIIAATRDGLMEFEQVNLIVTALNEIRDAIQALTAEAADDDSTMETIADGIGLIDPRLALLLEGVDAIETLLGGDWVPGGE